MGHIKLVCSICGAVVACTLTTQEREVKYPTLCHKCDWNKMRQLTKGLTCGDTTTGEDHVPDSDQRHVQRS